LADFRSHEIHVGRSPVLAETHMRAPAESVVETILRSGPFVGSDETEKKPDRRADVEQKQARVASLLSDLGCERLLLLEPENVSWMTSGAAARGILDPAQMPALFLSADGRCVVCSNVDSQRFFDEEIDGLGFQLKEWPWHWGREQLLTELCRGRSVACDRPWGGCQSAAEAIRRLRRALTPYERACYRALGETLSHALEATCRTLNRGTTEREVAGQVGHRLLHRGAQPLAIAVAADGRSARYRHCDFTPTPVNHFCVVTATARKYGLYATASRTVCIGPADDALRREHSAACKVSATYVACSWPDALPQQILATGERVYSLTGFEHEWLLSPQGHVTGRSPVELMLTPHTAELLQDGTAVTWIATAGAASSCDTYLITEQGPDMLTPTETWPVKKIYVQGAHFYRPDLLERED
jgi:Xaa-Pro aminopeptidase